MSVRVWQLFSYLLVKEDTGWWWKSCRNLLPLAPFKPPLEEPPPDKGHPFPPTMHALIS